MHKRDRNFGRETPDTYSASSLEMGECTAVLGTMTHALRAQKALANAAIHVSVIKISASGSAHGCSYGIVYPCAVESHVRTILARAGLAVKKYMGG